MLVHFLNHVAFAQTCFRSWRLRINRIGRKVALGSFLIWRADKNLDLSLRSAGRAIK
jgi:hypothetical protein